MSNLFRVILYSCFISLVLFFITIKCGKIKNYIKEFDIKYFQSAPIGSFLLLSLYFVIFFLFFKFAPVYLSEGEPILEEYHEDIYSIYCSTDSINNIDIQVMDVNDFVLGVNSDNTIYYFKIKGDKDLEVIECFSDYVDVKYDNDISPRIVNKVLYDVEYVKPNRFGELLGFKEEIFKSISNKKVNSELYIPSNAVIREYNN